MIPYVRRVAVNRSNLCTNPSFVSATTGWTNTSLTTFARVTSLPTTDGLPAGITTGLSCIGNASNDRATISLAVTSGLLYVFSCYARMDTTPTPTATNMQVEARDSGGTVAPNALSAGASLGAAASIDPVNVGGSFVRLAKAALATETATWTFGIRQQGAGNLGWHFTAYMVERIGYLGGFIPTTRVVAPRQNTTDAVLF